MKIFETTIKDGNPEELLISKQLMAFIEKIFTVYEIEILKGNVDIAEIAKEKGVLPDTIRRQMGEKKKLIANLGDTI